MWRCLRRLAALGFACLLLSVTASAGDPVGALGPVYDITHFDVLPISSPDSEQIAYAALFKYRDASKSDRGAESFRIINWLEATNHSFIVDVWKNRAAFEKHLAQPHSVAFRFAVQNVPPPDGICCIGSPIDDRQYSLVESFGTPWISSRLPATVGAKGALFVVVYVDLLQDGNPGKGKNQLVRYGAMSSSANRGRLLSFSLLQQLDRPNRYAILEAWDSEASYNAWQGSAVTASFVDKITPLLGSPLDHRLNSLCGETYIDGTGCVPP